ncbi:MAG: hypothetical protein IT458_20900 [Planctomycetes bacterium]|nr:hypothetical protein [Planctomycetota bacterium]
MIDTLYGPPPDGFTRTIHVGEPLIARGKASGRALVYLTAAYAQQTKWCAERGEAHPTRLARNQAFELCREVVPRGAGSADLLRYLWATEEPADDDLVVFQGDPEFQQLFGPPA